MELNIFEVDKHEIAEVVSEGVVIHSAQDALDLIANASYQGAVAILLNEKNLMPEFFDLKTGVAGEILQKFTNYQMKVAVIGELKKFESESLRAFIRESNRGDMVVFTNDRAAAIAKIANP